MEKIVKRRTFQDWEKIIKAKAGKDGFYCSWRYRDFRIQQVCASLERRHIIKKDWKNYKPGGHIYLLIKKNVEN